MRFTGDRLDSTVDLDTLVTRYNRPDLVMHLRAKGRLVRVYTM